MPEEEGQEMFANIGGPDEDPQSIFEVMRGLGGKKTMFFEDEEENQELELTLK